MRKRGRKKRGKQQDEAVRDVLRSLELNERAAPEHEGLTYRTLSLRADNGGGPASLDEKTRSVEVVAATEAPVDVLDRERWEVVSEVLLMRGCVLPETAQMPLLDSHDRWDTRSVLGSARELRTVKGELVGRAFFSTVPEAEGPFTKVREGHLTDFSVGYRVTDAEWIPAGEKATIGGRTFDGPLRVATKWVPKELSVVPIGADGEAKARGAIGDKQERGHKRSDEEGRGMDKQLREYLEKRGLAVTATEVEAWAFLQRLELPKEGGQRTPENTMGRAEPATVSVVVDPEKERAAGAAAERARIDEITAMCARFDVADELRASLVNDGTAVVEARAKVMDALAEARKKQSDDLPGFMGPRFEVQADETDKFRAAAGDALLIRASGMFSDKARASFLPETPAPGAHDLAGYSLTAMARECLRYANQPMGGRPLVMVGRAMTTSDFPLILANVANKSLFAGWETAPETWRTWCATGQVSDFKTHSSVRASETDDLDEIPEHGQYKYGDRTEAQETYSIATYGKLFAITRQTIINDDLSALSNIPANHGEAANRKVGDLPYAVITANAAMGDGTALFHADHSNLAVGALIDPVGTVTMAGAIRAMKSQKDLRGLARLNIRPQFFIGPVALEGSVEVFFRAEKWDDSNKAATTPNIYSGSVFTRVYEPRLDDDSAAAWYMSGPKGKTVTVFFLDGVEAPYMETKTGWTVDGVEYKVRIDAGARAMDYKALYRNAGT